MHVQVHNVCMPKKLYNDINQVFFLPDFILKTIVFTLFDYDFNFKSNRYNFNWRNPKKTHNILSVDRREYCECLMCKLVI